MASSSPPPHPPSPPSAVLHGCCSSLELRLHCGWKLPGFHIRRSSRIWFSLAIHTSRSSLVSALSQVLHMHTHVSGSRCRGAGPAGPRTDTHSLGDTQVVVDLADQRVPVLLPLRPDRDQLQGVGPSAELPVHRSHHRTGAAGQVDPADGALRSGGEVRTLKGRGYRRGGATRREELAAHLSPLVVRVPPVGDAEPCEDAPPPVPRPQPAHVLKHVLWGDNASGTR